MSAVADPQPGERAETSEARRLAVEQLLSEAMRLVERSRPMPFSTSVMINGEELLAILQQAAAALPDEMRAARWMLKERDEVRVRSQREGRRDHRRGPGPRRTDGAAQRSGGNPPR